MECKAHRELELPQAAVWPDYGDGGLFGLVRSFSAFLDGARWRAPGAVSSVQGGGNTLVFVLVDGLGDDFLRRDAPASALQAHRRQRISSVFPSTTASAITTTMSGLSPAQHGLTGWFIRDDHFGGVLAPLPLRMRGDDAVSGLRVAQRLFPYRSFYRHRVRPTVLISPNEIAWSPFSRRHGRGAQMRAYAGGVGGLADAVVDAALTLRAAGGGFVHAYHPRYDALSHDFGPRSNEAHAEFERIDAAFVSMLERLAGTDVDLVVSADHGFTETDDDHQIVLAEHPELEGLLETPLFGERRAAFCAVRPGAEAAFEARAREVFAGKAVVAKSAELRAHGLFGPGKSHARLAERTGTHTLLMEPGWTVVDHVEGEQIHPMRGVHGGLSPDEMWVPLIHARC